MAALENLRIVVNVEIEKAVQNLKDLQEEIEDVADKLKKVDSRAQEGIGVRTNVDSIEDDLQRIRQEMRAFEMAHDLDIDTNVDDLGGAAAMSIMMSRGGGGGGGGGMGGIRGIMNAFSMGDKGGLRGAFSGLSEGLSELSENSEITNLNMSDMHNVLARIVPLLLVFLGAIPAAITAMWTLAAAGIAAAASLMALAGFGAMGFAMQGGQFNADRLADAFDRLRDDFIDAFAPLANSLEPLFTDALGGLETFFDAIAAEGDALLELTDEARAFGGFILEFVPRALRTLAALVESMSGIFANMGQFLNQNFTNIVRMLVGLTAEIVPNLAKFVMVLGRALPAIARLSLGFLQVATMVVRFIGAIGLLVSKLGVSERILGVVIGSLLAFVSIAALGASVLGSIFVTALISSIKSLFMFFLAAQRANISLLLLAGNGIIAAVGSLYNLVAGLAAGEATMWGFITSVWSANAAMAAFLTLVTVGAGLAIVGAAMSAAAGFMSMADGIDSATSSLKDFKRVQGGMGDSGFGGSGGDPYAFDPDDDGNSPVGGNNTSVFNVESSGNPDEDRSNLDHADWLSGRTTGG